MKTSRSKIVMVRTLISFIVLIALSGCQTMGPSEYGLRFRKLPPALLGGVSAESIPPGKTVFVAPGVDSIYRFDTATRRIEWGKNDAAGALYTRARDGNEVALEMTVLYRVVPDQDKLVNLITSVATDDEEVERVVFTVARADIREEMNILLTSEFLKRDALDAAVASVRTSMRARLDAYGISVDEVILDGFQFERLMPNGSIDSSYADKLQEVQQQRENTERERARIATIKAQKEQELNETRALVNRMTQEAEGYKLQTEARGIAFLSSRTNEAEGVLAKGKAEVEGLVEQLNALAAPGGEAIVRVEIARRLAAASPRFVLIPQSSGGLDLQRLDANQLLGQIGIAEAMRDDTRRSTSTNPDASAGAMSQSPQ
jgi:hypothetical protein